MPEGSPSCAKPREVLTAVSGNGPSRSIKAFIVSMPGRPS